MFQFLRVFKPQSPVGETKFAENKNRCLGGIWNAPLKGVLYSLSVASDRKGVPCGMSGYNIASFYKKEKRPQVRAFV